MSLVLHINYSVHIASLYPNDIGVIWKLQGQENKRVGDMEAVNKVKTNHRPVRSFDGLMIFETYLQNNFEAETSLMNVFVKSKH